jgi:hypothetical protein
MAAVLKNDPALKMFASLRYALPVLLLLFLGACWPCDPPAVIDLGKIPDSIMQLNPYEDGKIYRFRHSGGLVIEYAASRQSHEEWIRCERCCTYEYKFEVNSTILTPDYPVSGFRIELANTDSTFCSMGASAGYYYFHLPSNDYQRQYVERVDSVMIDDKVYRNVFKVKSDYGSYYDRDILFADSLYYSYSDGIIRLIMSNGETFTRHE